LIIEIETNKIFGLHLKPTIVDIAHFMLRTWDDRAYTFFDKYDEERGRLYFLYDVEKLASCIKKLSDLKNIKSLINIGDYTELFHNRHLAQLMVSYRTEGNPIELKLATKSSNKNHDFSLNDLRCE